MGFWDSVTGRLAHFRRERSQVSEGVYRQLIPYYQLLCVNCGEDERLAQTIRNYVASVFQSIEACTSEEHLSGPFLESFRKDFLSYSHFDWSCFFAETHFQNAALNFSDAPSQFRLSLLTNVFTGICSVYRVDENACSPWFHVCETIGKSDRKPIERKYAAVCLWYDNVRRLLGNADLSRDSAIRWIAFQDIIDKCAKQIVSETAFDATLMQLIEVHSR